MKTRCGWVVLLACGLVVGCDKAPDSKAALDSAKKAAGEAAGKASEKVKEGTDALKKAFLEKKEKLEGDVKTQMADLDKKIDELKTKIKDATGDAKAKLEDQLKGINEKRKKAEESIGKLKDAKMEDFEGIQKSISGSLDDLKKSFEKKE